VWIDGVWGGVVFERKVVKVWDGRSVCGFKCAVLCSRVLVVLVTGRFILKSTNLHVKENWNNDR